MPTLGPPTILLVPTNSPFPTTTPMQATGVTYAQICDIDESNMSDFQLQAHAAQFSGQGFTGWQGWVYGVVSRVGSGYDLHLSIGEPDLLRNSDIMIENIPTGFALRLEVKQHIVFNGRVARVEYTSMHMCNPVVVDNSVLQEK
jgi:hypothetical protein